MELKNYGKNSRLRNQIILKSRVGSWTFLRPTQQFYYQEKWPIKLKTYISWKEKFDLSFLFK